MFLYAFNNHIIIHYRRRHDKYQYKVNIGFRKNVITQKIDENLPFLEVNLNDGIRTNLLFLGCKVDIQREILILKI